jgi:hypothetical protein
MLLLQHYMAQHSRRQVTLSIGTVVAAEQEEVSPTTGNEKGILQGKDNRGETEISKH